MEENTKNENIKWKALKEICKISTGKLNANAKVENGEYPFFTCQKVPNKIDKYSFNTEAVLMAGNGNVGNVHYYSGKFDAYQRTYVIESSEVNVKFLYYYLKTFFKGYIENYKKEGIISYITLPVLEKFLVPLPPLKKQAKIVAVLDKFTELTEELTEELTAREAQYEYYRNMLLSQEWIEREEGKEVEWKRLEEICKILDSKRKPITRKNRIEGIYPYYGANGIKSFIKDYIFDETLILMGEDGSVMDKNKNPVLHWIDNQKIWVNNHAHVLGQSKNKYNLKYIYYFLSTIDVSKIVKGLPLKLNQSNLRKIKILIPSFKTQQKIVDFLDNFEALVKDIKQGLPKEIELRQKQYKYYREKLLTFEKK